MPIVPTEQLIIYWVYEVGLPHVARPIMSLCFAKSVIDHKKEKGKERMGNEIDGSRDIFQIYAMHEKKDQPKSLLNGLNLGSD